MGEPSRNFNGTKLHNTKFTTALHLVLTVVQAYAEYAKKKSAINDFIMEVTLRILAHFCHSTCGRVY